MNIWTYWENPKWWDKMYGYIEMCIDAIRKYSFPHKVITVNRNSLKKYVKDIHPKFYEIEPKCMQADYARLILLSQNGGVWLDADTILIKNISSYFGGIIKKYGIFWGSNRSLGRGTSYNGVMGCNSNNYIIDNLVHKANEKLKKKDEQFFHTSLGPMLFDPIKDNLKTHYILPWRNFYSVGWRNINKFYEKSNDMDNFFSSDIYGHSLFNRKITRNAKWFYKMSKKELLQYDCVFTKMYKKVF